MATATTVAEAVVAVIDAALSEVDAASTADYLPAVESQKVALIATALGHADEGHVYSAGWMHVIHRLRLEFWTKVDQGDVATCVTRARDAGYRAMRALVAGDVTSGYTLASQNTMTYAVDPQVVVVGDIPYFRGVLTVAVMQKETV